MRQFKKLCLLTLGVLLMSFAAVKPELAVSAQDSASVYPVSYQLNAMDPAALAEFYEDTMGMTLIESDEDYFQLGTSSGETLLEIYPASVPRGQTLSTGLYHTAFLYDNRAELASHLAHLFDQEVPPIEGFTHHGVSDAIYAADPEGNGIELYWDFPEEDWEYENDQVTMLNEPLDYIALMEEAEEEFVELTDTVQIGHFHLVSSDLDAAGDFYASVLGFETTSITEGDTHFQASGDYHHHIANNVWFADQNLSQPEDDQQGLRAMVWEAATADVYAEIKTTLETDGIEFTEENGQLHFKDASGLGNIVQTAAE